MQMYKLIYPDTAENEYRVELEIDVQVTPPDWNNNVSDIDYLGCTELIGFRIISVQKRIEVENSPVARKEKDWLKPKRLSYNWEDVQMEDLSPEEQEELNELINKEVMNECNC